MPYDLRVRLLVTADIHYNHPRSKPLADELIDQMNRAGGDALLVVGDTGVADGPGIEHALTQFRIRGPKLFVAGNHEFWSRESNSASIFEVELPRRIRAIDWHWLEDDPFVADQIAIVGSVGWYDYSFAVEELQIPQRFYAAKISPGVAERLSEHKHLILGDESEHSKDVIARWNDGKFVKLGMTDHEFLATRLESLRNQLDRLRAKRVIAAIHHVPFLELLPPRRGMQWDFARAYLGSSAMGELLRQYENIEQAFCGHSHWPAEAQLGSIQAINVGSGYRAKRFTSIELPD